MKYTTRVMEALLEDARNGDANISSLCDIIEILMVRHKEVIKYCLPHTEQMYAARIIGILEDKDFRDVVRPYKFSGE